MVTKDAHTLDPTKNKVGVGQLFCPGIVWEPIGETSSNASHQECSATVISASWVTVNWLFGLKSGTGVREQISIYRNKKHAGTDSWTKNSPQILICKVKATTTTYTVLIQVVCYCVRMLVHAHFNACSTDLRHANVLVYFFFSIIQLKRTED